MSVEKSRISLVGNKYCVSGDLDLALEVALTTGRPLLLFGDPGSGKSSFAMWAAHKEKRRYYEYVVTARTQPQDLLWSFDSIRRLRDATAGEGLSSSGYIRPGVLWWAFDRVKAKEFDKEFGDSEPDSAWNKEHAERPAVVLIDEIDKADPDLPNSLLVPLGNRYFTVTDLETNNNEVRENPDKCSLIIITTNDERELPQPFIRRCVVFRLQDHKEGDLEKIAEKHFDNLTGQELQMVKKLVKKLLEEQEVARNEGRRAPGTAEFLDAVRACRERRYHLHGRLDEVLGMLYVKQPSRSRQ